MSITYHRYFYVIDGPLIEAMNKIYTKRKRAGKALDKLAKELGAETIHVFNHTGRPAGVKFASPPDAALWRRSNGLWMPKKNSLEGKDIALRLDAVPTAPDPQEALKTVGLLPNFPAVIDGRTGRCSYLHGKKNLYWVVVPWRDVPKKEMDMYKRENAAGTHFNAGLSHLQWKPHPSMTEIEHWEYVKQCADNGIRV